MEDREAIEHAKTAYKASCGLQKACVGTRAAIISFGEKQDPFANALKANFLRACYSFDSIVRLTEPTDAQTIFHSVRCIFELYNDAADLIAQPALVDKFSAFNFVSRFAAAERLVRMLDEHSFPTVAGDEVERQFY